MGNWIRTAIRFHKVLTSKDEIIKNFEAYVQKQADEVGWDYQQTENAILWSVQTGIPWMYYNTEFDHVADVFIGTIGTGIDAIDQYNSITGLLAGLENDCKVYNRNPGDKFKGFAVKGISWIADLAIGLIPIPVIGNCLSTVNYYVSTTIKLVWIGY